MKQTKLFVSKAPGHIRKKLQQVLGEEWRVIAPEEALTGRGFDFIIHDEVATFSEKKWADIVLTTRLLKNGEKIDISPIRQPE